MIHNFVKLSGEDRVSSVILFLLPDCCAESHVENKRAICRVQSSTEMERLSHSIGLAFLKITCLTRDLTA